MSAEAGEHVMVVSHMRSGTHLLLDLLGNNLQPWQTSYAALGPLEIDDLLFVGRTSVRELRHKLDEAPRVVKTHAHLPSRDFFVWGEHDHDVFDDLCSSALVVYAVRRVWDVIVSAYYYEQRWNEHVKGMELSAYLRGTDPLRRGELSSPMSRAHYLAFHLRCWLGHSGVELVRFDDVARRPRRVVRRLEEIAGSPRAKTFVSPYHTPAEMMLRRFSDLPVLGWVSDRVRWRLFPELHLTSVSYRSGAIGKGLRVLSERDRAYVGECFESQGLRLCRDGYAELI